jgi:hypothetical protein
MVRALDESMSQEDKKFALAQLEIYRKIYKQVNKVYAKIHGVALPFNEFYSPIRRGRTGAFDYGDFLEEKFVRQSVKSKSALKKRTDSAQPLEDLSDVDTFQAYSYQMSHFIAMADKVQTLTDVFGDQQMREVIRQSQGKVFLSNIDFYIENFNRGGVERSQFLGRTINKLNTAFARSVLGLKPAMTPKQLVSAIAMVDDIPIGDALTGLAAFAQNPKKWTKILGDSELIRARGVSVEQDIAAISKVDMTAWQKKEQKVLDSFSIFIKLGDRGAIYPGGTGVYIKARKDGHGHKEALRIVDRKIARSQQSRDLDKLTRAQLSGAFGRTMFMFMSAPNAYYRLEVNAIADFKRSDKTADDIQRLAKKIAIYHFILPSLWQWVGDGFEWDEKHQIRAMALGAANGFVLFGDLLAAAIDAAIGAKRNFRGKNLFALDFFNELSQGVENTIRGIADLDMEEFLEGIEDLGRVGAKLRGAPVAQFDNVVEGVEDIERGDTERGTYRVLGWPRAAVKQKGNN